MSKNKFRIILMALVAMSFFKSPLSFAQSSTASPSYKIKTPDTKSEFKGDKSEAIPASEDVQERTSAPSGTSTAAPRRLQQHGLGIGLGQTFLLGDYSDHGNNKITMDLLYSYAASYSFDLLVNAHMSEHKNNNEKMKVMGLTGSIKGRMVEFDNLSPYFLAGLGFYAPQARRTVGGDTQWSDQKLTFGLNFGGGVDLRLNESYVVGILGQMHWPFKVQQEDQPDLKGYYFKLLITGMYLF